MADSLTRFARGLGMARSGDLAGAKREIQALQELRSALEQAGQSYWGRSHAGADPCRRRWVAYAEGCARPGDEAHARGSDGEDGSVSTWRWRTDCTQCATCSVSCCFQIGQPAAALEEFEASLKENPNRYRSLSGAGRAAEAAATGRRPSGTSRSSSRCPARPTGLVQNWTTRMLFSGGDESQHR